MPSNDGECHEKHIADPLEFFPNRVASNLKGGDLRLKQGTLQDPDMAGTLLQLLEDRTRAVLCFIIPYGGSRVSAKLCGESVGNHVRGLGGSQPFAEPRSGLLQRALCF